MIHKKSRLANIKMKNKIIFFSTSVLLVSLVGNNILHYFSSFISRERKCAQYKPMRFDITFSHRNQCLQSLNADINERSTEWNMNTLEEIEARGYNVSTHTILSKDGYYSTMYRISDRLRSPTKRRKRPVLVFHGVSSSAKSWIIQPGSRNLAFTLADAGYDVWLANKRGTTPSKNHTHLDADKDFDYWDFGIDHVSTLDLPLMIDLILRESGTDQIYYVCHSGGCGILLGGLMALPELNNKIKATFFLAPGGILGSSYSPFSVLFPPFLERQWEQLLIRLFGGKFSGESSVLLGLTPDKVCEWSFMRCGICDNLLFAIFGADPEQMDYNNLPNILRKMRDNTAMRILLHAKQLLVETCEFQRFDFGEKRNLVEYGSANPPLYNLSRMAVPTYIFYGEADNIVTPLDVARLKDAVPAKYLKGFHRVEWEKFNHIDFFMAKDADILVYHKIRDIMNKLE